MKLMVKIFIWLAIFGAGLLIGSQLVYTSSQSPGQIVAPASGQITIKVSLMIDNGQEEIKTFNNVEINQNATVFELLKKITEENNIILKYQDYGGEMGVFVEAIGDNTGDMAKNQFWQFWVNNEYAKVGPSNTKLKNGDVVEWKYTKGQF
jgi:hypothetical protein